MSAQEVLHDRLDKVSGVVPPDTLEHAGFGVIVNFPRNHEVNTDTHKNQSDQLTPGQLTEAFRLIDSDSAVSRIGVECGRLVVSYNLNERVAHDWFANANYPFGD